MRRLPASTVVFAALTILMTSAPVAGAQDSDGDSSCAAPEYRQFDFWVGDWRVTDSKGEFQGTNRVENILGGCAIQENWEGAQGTKGHSYNIYAQRRQVWHQTWVDSNGALLLLEGGLVDGRMVLSGETPARDGPGTVQHEISWEKLPGGRVRQVWRISGDGGSTWNEAFAGIYTPRK